MLFVMRQTFGLHGISQMFPVCELQISYKVSQKISSLRCSDFCARHLAQVYGFVDVVGGWKVAAADSSDLHRLWGKLTPGASFAGLPFGLVSSFIHHTAPFS